ncbi:MULTISPECIES: response regulator transcription factor [unclassified Nocardioides]|uniref:response regulator transcription factor n=1 Tax=unclassified Nocardioides TaxID=2615069 RepID=UPI0007031D57|nr:MULTISPECIES: response regulator transcription factor [unclassified Nocardioides]KRC53558.1 two-component system response regulator [Nocardioides sp. Root79]KRC67966.1 two-component system response regulator [Nocardioides sp. Root240]
MLGEVPVRLLIVEDDDAIAAPLVRAVQREGYDVDRVAAGLPAIDRVAAGDVDLVLLDLGLPDMDGLDVCRRLRTDGYAGGIVILTARAGELDRVVGLDVGADDYLAKPFSLSELLARVRALLRRSLTSPGAPEAVVAPVAAAPATAGSALRVDRATRRARVGETELSLTAKEFDVLALLDDDRGAVVTREDLMARVWDENWFGSTKTLDTTIGRLRQKLVDGGAPVTLATVRGVGFRLEDAAPDA